MRIISLLILCSTVLLGSSKAQAYDEVDIYHLARVIYHEARGEPFMGRLLVGYTVRRRAELNRWDWGGNTIRGVVCYQLKVKTRRGLVVRSQYSGIKDCASPWVVEDPRAWERSKLEAAFVLSGWTPMMPWRDAVYYLDPPNSQASSRCWFARDLLVVGWYGTHLFHREAVTEEDKQLLRERERPADCPQTIIAAR